MERLIARDALKRAIELRVVPDRNSYQYRSAGYREGWWDGVESYRKALVEELTRRKLD